MSDDLATTILRAVGGRPNVLTATNCMTRLRLTLHDPTLADLKTLKTIPGVLGVVVDENEYQVVLGPGRVVAVAAAVNLLLARADSPETMKEAVSMQPMKNSHSLIKPFLKRLSAIFVPLIPITVASGMIAGITNIAVKLGADPQNFVIQILAALGWGVFGYLTIFVGFQTAREFGGTPAMGGLAGVILINPAIAEIQIDGMAMLPGRGGVEVFYWLPGLWYGWKRKFDLAFPPRWIFWLRRR